MGKVNVFILAILALSVAGNIVQSYQYRELSQQRDAIYDGVIEHLKATLQRERSAITDSGEYKTLVDRLGQEIGAFDPAQERRE